MKPHLPESLRHPLAAAFAVRLGAALLLPQAAATAAGPQPSPSVVVSSIATPHSPSYDRVSIHYALRSPKAEDGHANIRVTFSVNGAQGPFQEATEATGAPSNGTRGLSSNPSGASHVFVWNSFHDLDPRNFTHGQVIVRVSASSGHAQTSPFSLDNRLLATVAGHVSALGVGDGLPATEALVDAPYSCHALPGHAFLYTDPIASRVREFTVGGASSTVAGAGIGYSGDGGPATEATLNFPEDAVQDSHGVIFIADTGNVVLRAVNPVDGTIQTVASDPRFVNLASMRCLPGNQLLIVDSGALQIFRFSYTVDASGSVSGTVDVVLGTGEPGAAPVDGVAATDVNMGAPTGDLQDDGAGNIYYSEYGSVVRKFTIGGTVSTVAGSYLNSAWGGDGGPALAATLSVSGLAYDPGLGQIYVADSQNQRVRRFRDGGDIETVAGDGVFAPPAQGAPAAATSLANPGYLSIDAASGAVVVSSASTHQFYAFTVGGPITVAAGQDQSGPIAGARGPAPAATLATPLAAVAPEGDVYVAEEAFGRLLRVGASHGRISNLAGDGIPQFAGIPGALSLAHIDTPTDLVAAGGGRLLIPSENQAQLLVADVEHDTIAVLAGSGQFGTGGDGGPADQAEFITPSGVALSRTTGDIYICDEGSATIRRIDAATGLITTVAGGGSDATSDGIPATQADLVFPTGVAVDAQGTVYICECSPASAVRKVTADGTIHTIAGVVFSSGYNGDGPATQALLDAPLKVAVDSKGRVYIADQGNSLVRRVNLDGNLATLMGNRSNADAPDGVPALGRPLNGLWKVDVDARDNIYVSEFYGTRVRRFRAD